MAASIASLGQPCLCMHIHPCYVRTAEALCAWLRPTIDEKAHADARALHTHDSDVPNSVGMSTRKRTSVFGAPAPLTAPVSAPGQVGKMQAAAEQEEPLELNKALQLCGGVDGAYHRHLVAILNTANMSRLCSLKGIGKQRARKLVEMRQMQPHMPLLTHVQQLAAVVGMTSKQIDKFFADNALAA